MLHICRISLDTVKEKQNNNNFLSILEEEISGVEKIGSQVRVPRADDETFQAFFTPALQHEKTQSDDVEVDLDAIDSGSRQL